MYQSSARDEALVAVVRSRGLVRGDQLEVLLAGASAGGLAQSLRAALPPEQFAAAHEAARRARFACGRGCVNVGFDELASLASLACPRCGGGLRPTDEPPIRATGAYGAARPSDRHEGRFVAGYEVLAELGRGSFGVVYKVRRPGLERPFALKVLLAADAEPELLARFQLEAQIASKLEHPGIVGVFDAGLQGERPYLVMDFCAGATLRERLRQGPLPPLEAARLVADVARAVAYAHERGVLHRDLKPANIILEAGSGRPRVTDFGLARDRSLARSMTRTGDVVGTPAYAAPEQLRGEKDVDARIDVWALGVILYECLTGHRPFVGADVVSLAQQVLHGPLRPPRELEPGVPEPLEQACLRALERERFKRTATAAALADELEACVRASAPRSTSRRRAAQGAAPPRAAGRRSLALLGAALALAGAGVAALVARTSTPEATTTAIVDAPAPAPAVASTEPGREPPTTSETRAPGVAAPAPRRERAPDAEVVPLLEAAERMIRLHEHRRRRAVDEQALALVVQRGPELAARYPDDGRAVFLGAYGDLFGGKDELAARRAMARALSLDPPVPDALRDRVARLCFALGFQRAAADALEPVVAARARVDARQGLHLTLILAKSSPPVADPARAAQVARRTLEASDDDYADGDRERDQPRAWEVRMALADLLLFHGDKAAAVALVREAAERTRWNADQLATEAARLEAMPGLPGGLDVPLRQYPYAFEVTKFLQPLAGFVQRADLGEDRAAAGDLVAQADARTLGPEKAAVLLVTAGRLYARIGAHDEATRAFEAAAALDLPEAAADVRSLVRRCLARAVLDADPTRAERLALEAVAAAEDPACTPGERADAWLLVGFARRARGEASGVGEALARVAELLPHDARDADALRAGKPPTPQARPATTPSGPAPAAEPVPDLEALLVDAARVIRLNERRALDDEARVRLLRGGAALLERAREDGRAAYVVALASLLGGGDELEARRGLVRAIRAAPALGAPQRDRAARLCHALGFERAAADLLEPLFEGEATPDAEHGLCLVQTYMKSAPPVQHVERSTALVRRLIQGRAADPRDGDALMPPTWDLHANLGELLLHTGDDAGAAQAYRDAAGSTSDPRSREAFLARADLVAAGTIDRRLYDVPGRVVNFHFPLTDFLRRTLEPRALADRERSERMSAQPLLAFARREGAERPEQAALTAVMAARLLARAGDADGARQALEVAAAIGLPARASDVRALVARTLARALVEHDAARAEALALEAAQVPDDAPLTAGERADAWVVVALARRARGDAAGAREAAGRAAACGPFDRRGLDALGD